MTGVPLEAKLLSPLAERLRRERLRTSVSTGRGSLLLFRHITLLFAAVLVLLLGLNSASSTRYGLIFSTVYAIAILGNNAISATLGEYNLAGGAYLAVGAYTVADCLEHGLGLYLTLAIAFFGAGLAGLVLAIPTTRLTGLSTALVTFALAYSVDDLATYLKSITGGDAGKYVPSNERFLGLAVNGSSRGMLEFAVVIMVIAGVAHLWLFHRRPGRVALSVGQAELAASVFATPVRWVKLLVWAWAAALGGLAGVLYGLTVGFVSSQQWDVSVSIYIFVGGLIGGVRSVNGAWIGGILVGGLPLWLQNVVPIDTTTVFFGVILILALVVGGKGLSEFGERVLLGAYARVNRSVRWKK